MKKTLPPLCAGAVLILALLSSMPIRGQDADEHSIEIGAKIGYGQSLFRRDNKFTLWNGSANTFGFQGGAYGSYQALDFLKVRLEILYVMQGAKLADYDYTSEIRNTNAKVIFNTIQFPLMAELGIPGFEGAIKPKLLLGGFYSYAFSVQTTFDQVATSGGSSLKTKGSEDASDFFKHQQYGFLVGIGATVPIMDKPCLIELRYTHTLNDVAIEGFGYSYLRPTQVKYGDKLYPTVLSLTISCPIFNFN